MLGRDRTCLNRIRFSANRTRAALSRREYAVSASWRWQWKRAPHFFPQQGMSDSRRCLPSIPSVARLGTAASPRVASLNRSPCPPARKATRSRTSRLSSRRESRDDRRSMQFYAIRRSRVMRHRPRQAMPTRTRRQRHRWLLPIGAAASSRSHGVDHLTRRGIQNRAQAQLGRRSPLIRGA
jgi:hypothetical protein